MKKTYKTKLTKDELKDKMKCLKKDYKILCKGDNVLSVVRFEHKNKVRVDCDSRMDTIWKLDFDKDGEISVSRCITPSDIILTVMFLVIDTIFLYMSLYTEYIGRRNLVCIIPIVLMQLFIFYITTKVDLGHLVEFLKKHLGVTHSIKSKELKADKEDKE